MSSRETPKPAISDQYLSLLQGMPPEWGSTGRKHANEVEALCREWLCRSVLDYGCGNRSLGAALPNYLRYRGYDPRLQGLDSLPEEQFDLVACIDVMEHVEGEYVDEVLEQIYDAAKVGVYFYIATTEAKALLPDGRNAHITLLSSLEWHEKLLKFDWEHSSSRLTGKFIKFYGRKRSY